ncbi:hypothetical protein [Streptacidiphilus sp. EB129]|uniref:hypothetical protein n=1 Tax=Streptacidiphilus sp. EB129 TaxID=3156262 RepID=UPI003516F365
MAHTPPRGNTGPWEPIALTVTGRMLLPGTAMVEIGRFGFGGDYLDCTVCGAEKGLLLETTDVPGDTVTVTCPNCRHEQHDESRLTQTQLLDYLAFLHGDDPDGDYAQDLLDGRTITEQPADQDPPEHGGPGAAEADPDGDTTAGGDRQASGAPVDRGRQRSSWGSIRSGRTN